VTDQFVSPPPVPKLMDYPASAGIAFAIVFTAALLIIASKFDPTMGVLTISLLIVISFLGVVVFCMFFTVPNDEITSGVIGGLIAAFGAVMSHWLGRSKDKEK
jgi:uncharacterized BrkB/YihY/UPF0761 family membrane protein